MDTAIRYTITDGYVIGADVNGPFIWCLRCDLVSHNPNDIDHLYCGGCHAFLGDCQDIIKRAEERQRRREQAARESREHDESREKLNRWSRRIRVGSHGLLLSVILWNARAGRYWTATFLAITMWILLYVGWRLDAQVRQNEERLAETRKFLEALPHHADDS